MILQSLVRYYETLEKANKIAKPGWVAAKISYSLDIDVNGNLVGILPLKTTVLKGKKSVEEPRVMVVPEGTKRAVNIAPQFLWDNSKYLLGISKDGITIPGNSGNGNDEEKKKREKKCRRDIECFNAAKQKHTEILQGLNTDHAAAVKQFFVKWQPEKAAANPIIQAHLDDDVLTTANFVFSFSGENLFAQDDDEIKKVWGNKTQDPNAVTGQCLITGKYGPIARLHPSIKKIQGAQAAGASIVSFNAPAYESFGYDGEQGLNAPVSVYAAFAYTTALNSLVGNERCCKRFSDTTVVFWAENAEDAYCDLFAAALGNENNISQDDLKGLFEKLAKGESLDIEGICIKPDNKFYILGISPNAARLSIRFFLQDSFGNIIKHMRQYYSEMEMIKPAYEKWSQIPLWVLLQETANKNSRDKSASPLLAGATLRAILSGTKYPQLLYQSIILRAKAEQDNPDKNISKINWVKASVIKACLIRNYNLKEEISVALNEESNNVAYVLGRMFAMLERLQEKANPGLSSTIKDRYFNSACATPSAIFPILLKLSNHHLRKLKGNKGTAIYFENMLGSLEGKITMNEKPIPNRLSLEEQGIFILGYYHQTQKFFEKKEDK